MKRVGILAALLLAGWWTPCWAQTYGNIARSFTAGRIELGVALVETKRSLTQKAIVETNIRSDEARGTSDYAFERQAIQAVVGISPVLGVGLQVGNLALKNKDGGKVTGQEVAGSLLYQLQSVEGGMDMGIMLGYRSAGLANSDFSGNATQTEIGFGIGNRMSAQAVLYFDLIYSQVRAMIEPTSDVIRAAEINLSAYYGFPVRISKAELILEHESAMLAAIGMEFRAGERATVVAEVHALAESGFAFGVNLAF